MARGTHGTVDTYLSGERFIQHNPKVADGRENFKPLAQGSDPSLRYDEIVLLAGQGNFVATLCRAALAGVSQAQVDLFRLEDGMIVEHWDNAEPVPDHSSSPEYSVNSGKF